MKRISLMTLLGLLFAFVAKAQVVSIDTYGAVPQGGSYNVFGVRASLTQTFDFDVTVTGFIYEAGNAPNYNNPFSVVVPAGYTSAESGLFFQTNPTGDATAIMSTYSMNYGGVPVFYDITNGRLKFNSASNLLTVLDQLEADYDAYHDAYDANLDTTLSDDSLNYIDSVNNFDPAQSFKTFEALFPGYYSVRSAIEGIEAAYFDNNETGTNPSDVDLTFDDAMNTLFNYAYALQIGNDVYELTSLGTYLNGVLQDPTGGGTGSNAYLMQNGDDKLYNASVFDTKRQFGPMAMSFTTMTVPMNEEWFSECKTNKKKEQKFTPYDNGKKRFTMKVAIHSIGATSSIKAKIEHHKKKGNGKWKRDRTRMAIGLEGPVYSTVCNYMDSFIGRDPSASFKKRTELRIRKGWLGIRKTYSGEVSCAFDTNGSQYGTLVLTW